MSIRLSDYIYNTLASHGVRQIFLVTGGGAMHLNDAIATSGLRYICCHHEQACAIAAEGYARTSGALGVVTVTTGPGGINALNGVFGAFTDSVPMLVISGQVKRATCMSCHDLPGLRQLGDQEVNIISMAQSITKYSVCVTDPSTIRYHLERAIFLATHGRPGPCWLDIPVDVQSALISPDEQRGYDSAEDEALYDIEKIHDNCLTILGKISEAKRPVILAGTGVRVANAVAIFERAAQILGIPIATAWTQDIITSDSPYFCGRQGSIGDRAGNFTVQNSDLVLVIGSRLAIRQVSYNWENFAAHAYKIQVDIDPAEMRKPTFQPDLAVVCDAKLFLEALIEEAEKSNYVASIHNDWLSWCRNRVTRYPVVSEKQRVVGANGINPYHFSETLWSRLSSQDTVVCGNATACIVTFQTAQIQRGQRLFSNSGSASMGYDLPAAIGAAIARDNERIVCIAGDGSIQMNIQELQTIVHHNLPIKIFVLDNQGYLSIRLTQGNFFKHFIGESSQSGVSFPDYVKLAQAYGLAAFSISKEPLQEQIDAVLSFDGPALCQVHLDPSQAFEPKLSSRQLADGKMVSASLEDMYPFIDREELRENMLVPSTSLLK